MEGEVRAAMEDLESVLDSVDRVRSIPGEVNEKMETLTYLYTLIGVSARKYVEAIRKVTGRSDERKVA